MRIKPAIASTPNIDEMQKAPVIQITALYYIFLSFVREYERGGFIEELQRKSTKSYRKDAQSI